MTAHVPRKDVVTFIGDKTYFHTNKILTLTHLLYES